MARYKRTTLVLPPTKICKLVLSKAGVRTGENVNFVCMDTVLPKPGDEILNEDGSSVGTVEEVQIGLTAMESLELAE